MKTIFSIIIFTMICSLNIFSQTGYSNVLKNNLIETTNGSIVIVNSIDTSKIKIYINLSDEKLHLTQDDRIINVGNTIFQILTVEEKPFGKPNNVFTLANYAKSELKYLEDSVYKHKIKSNSEIIDLKDTKLKVTTIFWYYETPIMYQTQVKNHLYISFSYQDYIIGIYIPQFINQDFNKTKQLLLKIFNSISISNKKITLETLCNEIK